MSDNASGQQEVTLARDLTVFNATMIGVGAMIGAGIFVLTGVGAEWAGPAIVLAFILNGIATIFTGMVYAELGSCFPDAGGGYLWVKKALPQPAGFLAGWMSWYAHFVACSLYALGFGSFLADFLEKTGVGLGGLSAEVAVKVIAVVFIAFFTWINYRGTSETGTAQNISTILKLAALLAFVGFGLAATFGREDWWTNFEPYAPNGALGILVAMGVTFIGFEGYEIIAQSGEEIIEPKKNIPRAIFFSLLTVVPIYALVGFVAIGSQTGVEMPAWRFLAEHGELAISETARRFMPFGAFVLLFAGMAATASAMNSTIYSSSRVSFAMGRDRNLPDAFSHISSRTRTPTLAILLSAGLVTVGTLTLPIEDVAAGTVIMFKLLFLLVNVSVINLRRNEPEIERGYVVPLFPAVPIIGIVLKLALAFALFELSPVAWYSSLGWIALGFLIYRFYAGPREREAAETPVLHEEREWQERDHDILVGVGRRENIPSLAAVARRLARANDSAIWGMRAVEVPRMLSHRAKLDVAMEDRGLLEDFEKEVGEEIPCNLLLRATGDVGRAVLDSVRNHDIDLLVLGWPRKSRGGDSTLGASADRVVSRSVCDTVLVRLQESGTIAADRILVPVRDDHQSLLAVQVARWIAPEDAELHFVHLVKEGESADAETLSGGLGIDVDDIEILEVTSRRLYRSPSVSALLEKARDMDATAIVQGASVEGILRRKLYGDAPLLLAEAFDGDFLLVKKYEGAVKSFLQEFFGSRPTEDLSKVAEEDEEEDEEGEDEEGEDETGLDEQAAAEEGAASGEKTAEEKEAGENREPRKE